MSAPGDKLYHYSAWNNLFELLNKNEDIFCAPFEKPEGAARGTGTGLHIHISKDAMIHYNTYSNTQRAGYGLACAKLQALIYSRHNTKFVEIMAGRPSNEFSDFTKPKGLVITNKNHVKLINNPAQLTGAQMDHRTAINFNSSNDKTIEFRIFRSTKSLPELLKNIDFVDAACAFCRPGVASNAHMTDWIYFYEFVMKNRQDYKYLYKFFSSDPEFLHLLEKRGGK